MENFIKLIPTSALYVGVLFIGIGFMVVMLKGGKFKGKNFNFSASKSNFDSIKLIVFKSLDIQFNILKIEFKSRRVEQEAFTDDEAENIKNFALNFYRDIISRENAEAPMIVNPLVCRLELLLENNIEKFKKMLYTRYSEMLELFNKPDNLHDTFDYVKTDFENYKQRVIEILMEEASKKVSQSLLFTRTEIRKLSDSELKSIHSFIKDKLSDVLDKALEIQLYYAKKTKELRVELDSYINKLELLK